MRINEGDTMSNRKKPKNKNGQGSFQHLKNGRVRMYLQIGTYPDGRTKRITVTGSSETDCVKKMKAKEREQNETVGWNPRNDIIDKMTLEELCLHHLAWDSSIPNKLTEAAQDRRESTAQNHIGKFPISTLPVKSVTPNDIRQLIRDLLNTPSKRCKGHTLSASSAEKAFNLISGAYNWARTRYHLTFNPCDPIREEISDLFKALNTRTEPEEQVIVLSEADIEAIHKEVERKKGKWLEDLLFDQSILLLIDTGMRVGELCALRLYDYLSDIGVLCITKTRERVKDRSNSTKKTKVIEKSTKNDRTRNITLNQDAINALEKIIAILSQIAKKTGRRSSEKDYLYINRLDKPSCPSDYDARLRRFFRSAGIKIKLNQGAHVFRRTNATEMHHDGGSAEEIAAYIGDSVGTVQQYYIAKTIKKESDGKTYDVVPRPARRKKEETTPED